MAGIYDHVKTLWSVFYDNVLADIRDKALVDKALVECCKNRIYLAQPDYTYDNAAFAKDPWVFGAHLVTTGFPPGCVGPIPLCTPLTVPAPEDPMANIRKSLCKIEKDPNDFASQIECQATSLAQMIHEGLYRYRF